MHATKPILLLLVLGLCAAAARGARVSAGEEIRYPTEFRTQTQVINGKVVTTTVPTKFSTRETGTRLEAEANAAGTSRVVRKDPGGRDLVLIRFADDGPEGRVETGKSYRIAGVAYRAIGWRGADYCLMNLETREVLRFRPATDEEDDAD